MFKAFCDGCGSELKAWDKENAANWTLKNSCLESVSDGLEKQNRGAQMVETFCVTCRTKAPVYWEEKAKIIAESNVIHGNRLDKLRNTSFRQQPTLVAGKKMG